MKHGPRAMLMSRWLPWRGSHYAVERPSRRPGYALLGVLWICAGIAALGIAVSAAARDAISSSRNRIALIEAEWLAEGCLARARSVTMQALRSGSPRVLGTAPDAWFRLDSVLALESGSAIGECTTTARAVGARLDVNAAGERMIALVVRHAGIPAPTADSIAAALADWKDADDAPRPLGAEREWYETRGMIPPSNRPFADAREIAMVRGLASFAWEDLLDIEPGAIAIHHAAAPILAALPGFEPEVVARVIEMRRQGRVPRSFQDITDGLPSGPASSLMDALPELASTVTLEPAAWLVRAEARAGEPAVRVVVEMRLAKSGSRVRVARRRVWTR